MKSVIAFVTFAVFVFGCTFYLATGLFFRPAHSAVKQAAPRSARMFRMRQQTHPWSQTQEPSSPPIHQNCPSPTANPTSTGNTRSPERDTRRVYVQWMLDDTGFDPLFPFPVDSGCLWWIVRVRVTNSGYNVVPIDQYDMRFIVDGVIYTPTAFGATTMRFKPVELLNGAATEGFVAFEIPAMSGQGHHGGLVVDPGNPLGYYEVVTTHAPDRILGNISDVEAANHLRKTAGDFLSGTGEFKSKWSNTPPYVMNAGKR